MKACIFFAATVALAATVAYAQALCDVHAAPGAQPAPGIVCPAAEKCCPMPFAEASGICCKTEGQRCPVFLLGQTGCVEEEGGGGSKSSSKRRRKRKKGLGKLLPLFT